MTKTRLLTILVIFLTLLNLALLAGLWLRNDSLGPKHRPGAEGPRQGIIDHLGFDEQQIEAYGKLIEEHKRDIADVDNKKNNIRRHLFGLLKTDNQTQSDSLMDRITALNSEIEAIYFNHFLDIKTLCKEEQLDRFSSLSDKLGEMFKPTQIPSPKKRN